MPPLTDAKAEETSATQRTVDWNNPRVAAILEAAAKCFARKGFSATTLAEIGKELGLRKSIVHYYFASKAALIHEVQSYTYAKYLDRVQGAVAGAPTHSPAGMMALWQGAGEGSNVGLNIEVWSASRNDVELKKRAAALQREKRKLVAMSIANMVGEPDPSRVRDSLCTLVLGVLNGRMVSEYVEGEEAQAQEAFEMFLALLRAGLMGSQQQQSTPPPAPEAPPEASTEEEAASSDVSGEGAASLETAPAAEAAPAEYQAPAEAQPAAAPQASAEYQPPPPQASAEYQPPAPQSPAEYQAPTEAQTDLNS